MRIRSNQMQWNLAMKQTEKFVVSGITVSSTGVAAGHVAKGSCIAYLVGRPLLSRCLQRLLGVRALAHSVSFAFLFDLILGLIFAFC